MDSSSARQNCHSEVYHDKTTLVEVTIHRNSKSKLGKKYSEECWKSPKKTGENRRMSEGKQPGETNVKHLLQELREIVKISGIKDFKDFVDGFETSRDNRNTETSPMKLSSQWYRTNLEEKIHKLESDCLKYKDEADRCAHDNGVMSKQVEIGRETVNSLELQIVDLKKIISRLTRNNTELLGMVSEEFTYLDLIANLEKKTTQLSDQLGQEKFYSSDLEQLLHSSKAEVASLRSLSADLESGLRQGMAGLELSRSSRPVYNRPTILPQHQVSLPETFTLQLSKQSKSAARNQLTKPHRAQSRWTTLANAPSFQENPTLDLNPQFQPTTLDLSETLSSSEGIAQDPTSPEDLFSTVRENFAKQNDNCEVSADESLGTKVTDFIGRFRLNEDSLQPSLNIPHSKLFFQDPSMHISLSSSYQDLDMTKETFNTSLSEGKFLRGLEKSRELLETEFTELSDIEH